MVDQKLRAIAQTECIYTFCKIIVSQLKNKTPLGAVLEEAGLVSSEKVNQALVEQKQGQENVRIGDILVAKGYINPQTADFFAENWSQTVKETVKQPLGQYLKQAALLSEKQIQEILAEQQQNKLRFGEIAIAKGWIRQQTVNFFLRYLQPDYLSSAKVVKEILEAEESERSTLLHSHQLVSPAIPDAVSASKAHQRFLDIKLKLLNIQNQDGFTEQVLERILWWSGGQSFLTQKIFELASRSAEREIIASKPKQVDCLVEQKIIKSWQSQDLAEHFQGIRDRLLKSRQCQPTQLLRLYRDILLGNIALNESSKEQQCLLKKGLVVRQKNHLAVANPIYSGVFDRHWVSKELHSLESVENSTLTVITPATSATSALATSSPAHPPKFSKLRNSLLLLALVALLSLFVTSIVRRIAVRSAFDRGNELLRQKSFKQAVTEYNQLLNIDSNYFQAWTNRGYALAGLGQFSQMQESCSTATIIEPDAVYAWNCLGEALHNLNRSEDAIAAFDQAIALNPNEPIFLINKSESLKSLGREAESLDVNRQAIQVLERVEIIGGKEKVAGEFAVALTFLGNGYRKRKQYALAVDSYNRALEYSPNYFPAQIGKGIVLSKAKRYREAQQEYRAILNNQQLEAVKQAQTWFYLGKSLCQSQQVNRGLAAFDEAIKLKPEYEAAKQARINCSKF